MGSFNDLHRKYKNFNNPIKFGSSIITLILILALPITILMVRQQQDVRQQAAPPATKTATININPSTLTVPVGGQFTVSLVIDGGGQEFNASQAKVTVSNNMSINSLTITPSGSGGCNFTFANANKTPKVSNPSFAGAILKGLSANCTLYTMVLQTVSSGTATIDISKASVKLQSNSGEIFLSAQNGIYNIIPATTPTPTGAPTSTPTPTAVPTTIPTLTPTTAPSPIPTPTPIVLLPPTIDSQPSDTYQTLISLSGTKMAELTGIFVNGSTVGVAYPTSTTWQYPALLSIGANIFTINGRDSSGSTSPSNNITINHHKLGDIDGDNIVGLTDLSIFSLDWENTGTLNNQLSDMDNDGIVDLTDFSILARVYEE